MSPHLQTFIALAVVVIATALLVRSWMKKKQPGCGANCGAVSPEIRKLQARLRR